MCFYMFYILILKRLLSALKRGGQAKRNLNNMLQKNKSETVTARFSCMFIIADMILFFYFLSDREVCCPYLVSLLILDPS